MRSGAGRQAKMTNLTRGMFAKYLLLFLVWLVGYAGILLGGGWFIAQLPTKSGAQTILIAIVTVVAIAWGISLLVAPFIARAWHHRSL